MNANKRKKLEQQGWRVSDTTDFLGLTPDEAAIMEIRLALSTQLKRRRAQERFTQGELANKIGSSQPRIALAENGSRSVSLDLLLRALIATGATPRDIGRAITTVSLPR